MKNFFSKIKELSKSLLLKIHKNIEIERVLCVFIAITVAVLAICSISFISNRNPDGIVMHIYKSSKTGVPLSTYPDKIIYGEDLLEKMMDGSGEEALDVEGDIYIEYKLEYSDKLGNTKDIYVYNNGRVAITTNILEKSVYQLTQSEYDDIVDVFTK